MMEIMNAKETIPPYLLPIFDIVNGTNNKKGSRVKTLTSDRRFKNLINWLRFIL
jgi:hypothetical protein